MTFGGRTHPTGSAELLPVFVSIKPILKTVKMHIIKYLSFSIGLLIIGCTTAPTPTVRLATDGPPEGTLAKTVMDRRETITATGYAVIGVQNHRNAPQQRLLAIRAAKVDAYRGLAEQIYGLYLDANTTVSDMTVKSDTFRTRVEGVIYGATLTSINPINNDTYEVTLSLDKTAVNDLRLLYLDQVSSKRR